MKAQRLDEMPDVLDVNQVAAVLKISTGLVYEAARTGQIPSIRIGRRLRFSRTAIARLLEGNSDARQEG